MMPKDLKVVGKINEKNINLYKKITFLAQMHAYNSCKCYEMQ